MDDTMCLKLFSEIQVLNAITDLKRSHSWGVDGVSSRLLIDIVNFIVVLLAFLMSGISPKLFITVRVALLHKNDSRIEIRNDRPISLLGSISKKLFVQMENI